jgi:hypothetical protein
MIPAEKPKRAFAAANQRGIKPEELAVEKNRREGPKEDS